MVCVSCDFLKVPVVFYCFQILIFVFFAEGESTNKELQARHHVHRNIPDFIVTRVLEDGEKELRIHRGGITAKETWVGEESKRNSEEQGIRLWQVTDGRHFIQLIYDAGFLLRDCEYVREAHTVSNFLDTFAMDFATAYSGKDEFSSEDVIDSDEIDNIDSVESDFSSVAGRLDKNAKKDFESEDVGVPTRPISGFGNSTFVFITDESSQLTSNLRHMTNYRRLRRECKRLHDKIKLYAKNSHSKKNENQAARLKRELLLIPGTNWCGVGTASEAYNQLGFNAAADRCCRQHDHCPYLIQGFTNKFNLFNYRFHTISHCDCDERFRTCLKMANNAVANMVGKIFFNVVQMKCFVLKKEKSCSVC